MERIKNNWFEIFITAIILTYLFLPNNNSTLDAYDYAGSVKYGIDLFHPHHLIFNAFFRVIHTSILGIGVQVEPLRLIKTTNALFAIGTLALTLGILKRECGTKKAKVLTSIIACSFGMMRFATEAETYIIPIFFCVLSSLFFLTSTEKGKERHVLPCAISSATAMLFHQTAIFWGIGIFIGYLLHKKRRHTVIYAVVMLVVPLAYTAALVWDQRIDFSLGNLMRFVTNYYHSDSADISIGWVNFLLTPISLARTFIQIHGNIPTIFSVRPIYLIFVAFALTFLILAIRTRIKGGTTWVIPSIRKIGMGKFESSHLIAGILSLSFAFFSHGNAEFMVMLPFCAAFAFHSLMEEENTPTYILLAYAIGCWNIGSGILPNHLMDYYHDEEVIDHIETHPDAVYLLTDKNIIRNKYFYKKGEEPPAILIRYDKKEVRKLILEEAQKGKRTFTDVDTKNIPLSRTSILDQPAIRYRIIRHDKKIAGDLGAYYIDEIEVE